MSLDDIHAQWEGCYGCALCRVRSRVVVGEPWQEAPRETDPLILVVGEAPGAYEDRTGRPFVGPAGVVLREEILRSSGLRFGYITNLVACRSVGNRDPTEGEISACSARLEALVEEIEPEGLLLVGRLAAGAAKDGNWSRGMPTTAITHPSAFLHQGHPTPATRKAIAMQVAKVKRFLQKLGVVAEVTSRVPGENGLDCAHEARATGYWRHAKREPEAIIICKTCRLIVGEPSACS